MKLVVIESPYAGDVSGNVDYARDCLADSLNRGEAPFASHLLYTQPGVLDDMIAVERRLGIEAGFAWGTHADLVAIYLDQGLSEGMKQGMRRARKAGQAMYLRSLKSPFIRDDGSPPWAESLTFILEEFDAVASRDGRVTFGIF